jgi:hypothetical protein
LSGSATRRSCSTGSAISSPSSTSRLHFQLPHERPRRDRLVYFGKLRLRKIRQSGVLAASVGLFAIVAWGGTQLRPFLLPVPSNALLPLTLDPTLVRTVNVTLERDPLRDGSPAPAGRDPTLLAIQKSGVLRETQPARLQFSVYNESGPLGV